MSPNLFKSSKFILTLFLLVSLSCSSNNDAPSEPENPVPVTPAPGTSTPVETNPPNSTYPSAFSGQTRIGRVTTATKYTANVITSGLQSPWGITPLPDGRMLVTEKAAGSMRIVSANGNIGAAITGLPRVNAAGQGGLLGLCLDPNFSVNRMVYWSFSEPGTAGNVTAIAKGRLSADERTFEDVNVIYRAEAAYSGTNHYGGRVIFDRSGNLMVSSGERSDLVTRVQAQSLNSALGKIIRIDPNGQAPSNNPFIGQSGVRPELFSIGHRNPQGLALHPVTGEIWQSEHGPRGGDELNRLQSGANYGWPTITYGIEYSGQRVGDGIQQRDGMTQPVYYWDPVVSPSGMTFYSGNRVPEWQNNLFIGALSGMHIVRLVIENNRVTGEERLLSDQSQRFRDITQGRDGALYAITDQGKLYRIDKE